jgi:hypothetical protein
MPDATPPRPRVPLTVRGLYRGAELSGDGWAELGERDLTVAVTDLGAASRRGRVAVAYDAIDGARFADAQLTVFVGGGDLIELARSPDLAHVADALTRRACAFPELTLRLRALGSGRANPGSDHDLFFGPLLAARRTAAGQRNPLDHVAAFEAAALAAALDRTLAGFAAARFPESPADRRALGAELDEMTEGLTASFAALGAAAREVLAGADDARFVRWRAWAAAVQRVFDEADRAWIAALPALCDSRGQRGRFWRRLLKLGLALAAALPVVAATGWA